MNSDQIRAARLPATIGTALHEIDNYLADDAGTYRYDVEAGLAQLQQAIAVDHEIAPKAGRMTSDITPEFATQVGSNSWTLSWLPDRHLTREQALRGMELDEILSDPALTTTQLEWEAAGRRAAELGLTLEEVVVLLSKRLTETTKSRDRPSPAKRAQALEGLQPDQG
ncbi:hypothetical protein OHB26_39475 (plasmid) [Nocardia sp. NBC_01503]|uniref:hypothetical protein n=1 Tax=Nocardia sp. NBC_01503 TaxID=2975997 RepID=UPI002E7AFBBB|nr:hypothetical protein [Nocardia sp. NBC_01503]WTL36687.1 hypothetical protein OHB26_39100 [Nocardia sp. NBC_01503]WTL36760.1 hypothetical protein OHB26_39475 [Nocardia sp. NBC_01503]